MPGGWRSAKWRGMHEPSTPWTFCHHRDLKPRAPLCKSQNQKRSNLQNSCSVRNNIYGFGVWATSSWGHLLRKYRSLFCLILFCAFLFAFKNCIWNDQFIKNHQKSSKMIEKTIFEHENFSFTKNGWHPPKSWEFQLSESTIKMEKGSELEELHHFEVLRFRILSICLSARSELFWSSLNAPGAQMDHCNHWHSCNHQVCGFSRPHLQKKTLNRPARDPRVKKCAWRARLKVTVVTKCSWCVRECV